MKSISSRVGSGGRAYKFREPFHDEPLGLADTAACDMPWLPHVPGVAAAVAAS